MVAEQFICHRYEDVVADKLRRYEREVGDIPVIRRDKNSDATDDIL